MKSAPVIFFVSASAVPLVMFWLLNDYRLAVDALYLFGMAILFRLDERTEP